MTEKIIQEYIWKNRNNLNKLFDEIKFPNEIKKEKPWEITPSEVIFNTIISDYKNTWLMIKDMSIFGCEVPLKKDSESTIRADFLGLFNGTNGVAIIELKKSAQAERQAFTELLGYGNHIHTVFSPMSKIDIAYILISPMKERIVRESVINNIINERNTTFALVPTWKNDDISTLKLTPWIPTLTEIDNLISAVFAESNFDLYKITWDGLFGEWSPEKEGDDPEQFMIERMNTVSTYASQIMEAKGIHGFVYCSQTYSETRSAGRLINSIIIAGLNPYKATKNRKLLKKDPTITPQKASEIDVDVFNMLDIIPELKNKYFEEDTTNYFSDLSTTWSSEIGSIGFEVVKTLTKSLDKKNIEIDYGRFTWEHFQNNIQEDINVHNFNVRPTGIIRELYWEYSKLDYDFISHKGCKEHPLCFNNDGLPNYMIDTMACQYYFRNFIKRLFKSIS